MKKNASSWLMALLCLMAADVQAQEWSEEDTCCVREINFSAKALIGPNFLQRTTINGNKASYQTGYMVAGVLGYDWYYGLRLEAEYAFRRNEIKKIHFFGEGSSEDGHFQSSSYMGNVFWELPLALWECDLWNFRPFVGAGAGYDFQRMHSSNSRIVFDQKWNHFSWQVMTGALYPIFRNGELSLEYKFHQGGSHFCNHSVGIGLVYHFGFLR